MVSLGWVYQDSPLRKVQPAMSGTHLTPAERERLFELKMAQHSNAEIARRMGRHRSTIGRELKRFESHESWPACGRYFPDYAQGMAVARRAVARGSYWTRHRPLLAYVLRGLRREWSPEQISRRIVMDHPEDGEMRVSHTAIYAHVRADRLAGGVLFRRLRQGRKARRKQYGTGASASRIPGRVSIDQRPPEAEARETEVRGAQEPLPSGRAAGGRDGGGAQRRGEEGVRQGPRPLPQDDDLRQREQGLPSAGASSRATASSP